MADVTVCWFSTWSDVMGNARAPIVWILFQGVVWINMVLNQRGHHLDIHKMSSVESDQITNPWARNLRESRNRALIPKLKRYTVRKQGCTVVWRSPRVYIHVAQRPGHPTCHHLHYWKQTNTQSNNNTVMAVYISDLLCSMLHYLTQHCFSCVENGGGWGWARRTVSLLTPFQLPGLWDLQFPQNFSASQSAFLSVSKVLLPTCFLAKF